ncbi:MAG: hypothetical protein FWB80_10455 [Defluviitaleaceae bacterium]|nr:hypothetical protein [Defluviitaleaceae bacterium]
MAAREGSDVTVRRGDRRRREIHAAGVSSRRHKARRPKHSAVATFTGGCSAVTSFLQMLTKL